MKLVQVLFVVIATGVPLGSASPAPLNHAETARGMVSFIEWGVLVTRSNRTEGTHIGDAFGNPYSFADVKGTPYVYASAYDASFVDLLTPGNVHASLSLSEASLTTPDGLANITDCKIGEGYGDPENPPCARLVLSGSVSEPIVGSQEETTAKAALFARHPEFAQYPSDHSFFVAKLSIDGIWLIDAYGGATNLSLTEYYAAAPVNPSVDRPGAKTAAATAANKNIPPEPANKVGVARWMAKYLDWGVLGTTSTRSEGTSVGTPFGNPYSFADVGGKIYMYASDMDDSMVDVNNGMKRASLALSEASYNSEPFKLCKIGGVLGDPEDPVCARLVLSGVVTKVASGSAEETAAKTSLFARHPAFANYPTSHGFYVVELKLDGIWLVDIYGGPAIIKPADYLNASEPEYYRAPH